MRGAALAPLAWAAVVAVAACNAPARTPDAPTTAASPSAEADAGEAAVDASSSAGSASRDADKSAPHTIPMSCAGKVEKGDVCTPDPAFVKRLCDGSYPDLALVLMGRDAPFTHLYMRSDVDGWNAEGGASARARLAFDEEVLALRRRTPPANGIVVGAGGGYLVMRWDGNCYTVEEAEVGAKKPPSPKHGPIPFRLYSDRTKAALLEHPKVLAAYQRRGKECKGVISGDVPAACVHADDALSAAVVSEIRGGASIPAPERIP